MTPSTSSERASETAGPVRLGAIGTGLAMEKLHWPALRQLTDRFRTVAFSDASRQTAEHFASYAGANMGAYHADYHDLLARDDVDAVAILLPIPLLYDVARDALEAGKHVLCEKPAGVDLDQARDFLALERRFAGRTLLIAENFFYRDDLRLARQLLDAGAVGRPLTMTWKQAGQNVPREGTFSVTPWRHKPGYRGGPHLDGGVHMVAQIRLLCGDVQRVHGLAQAANSKMGGPSDLSLNLAFVSGAIGSYTSVQSEIPVPSETGGMRLYGTEGTLVFGRGWGEDGRTFTLHRAGGSVEEHRVTGTDGGYYNEWRNFYDAIRHGAPVVGTVTQSVLNMRVVLRGLDSAEGAGEVDLGDGTPAPLSEHPLSLWQPHGANGLFDTLPCEVSSGPRQG